ncbi:protein of unknown function [Paraburkholderia kururiensis]
MIYHYLTANIVYCRIIPVTRTDNTCPCIAKVSRQKK